jgi:hypothetical protein
VPATDTALEAAGLTVPLLTFALGQLLAGRRRAHAEHEADLERIEAELRRLADAVWRRIDERRDEVIELRDRVAGLEGLVNSNLDRIAARRGGGRGTVGS